VWEVPIEVGQKDTKAAYELEGLPSGKTVYFRVRASNIAGEGTWSEAYQLPVQTPEIPLDLEAESETWQEAYVSWKEPPVVGGVVESYSLRYRRQDGKGGWIDAFKKKNILEAQFIRSMSSSLNLTLTLTVTPTWRLLYPIFALLFMLLSLDTPSLSWRTPRAGPPKQL